MNKSKLKSYAPQARNDFIAMVTSRANQLGISESAGQLQVEPCTVQGDVAFIGGQAYPAKVAQLRQRLLVRIKQHGFGETMEAIAYTWFNRFAALRYMELHDYLGHGQRVLSSINPDSLPDILTHALELVEGGDLPGISRDDVAELKLAGKDGELYKRLLVAQCNKLASAMPFLFERIDDETELLLPENLLRTDSVVRKLVDSIDEADWNHVEIIGWLYQFYISEKKDAVIGKVVKSEDIPAATQLFTPNWIVKYLVQNSVGRLWLQANPQSTLASQWEYYIQPAEQTPEVQAQLDALIQSRIAEDGDSLNPESITVLDPACGSGHILVEAYDLLKAIYLERGYREREIPRLILQKNLFGLDIDDRAAQLAGFALLMKARADDRRLFTATDDAGNLQPAKLNVLSLQESKGLCVDELATHLAPFNVQRATISALVETFDHAKTFGSLIQIPYALKTHLAVLPEVLALVKQSGDMYATAAADDLLPLVQQAQVLALHFDAAIANPPYMGNRGYNERLKAFIQANHSNSRENIFAAFVDRCLIAIKGSGFASLVTMHNWMFLNRFQDFRSDVIRHRTIENLVHHGVGAFEEITGEVVQTVSFTLRKMRLLGYSAAYISALSLSGQKKSECISDKSNWYTGDKQSTFQEVPGEPIAYWLTSNFSHTFSVRQMGDICEPREGLTTGNNAKHVRQWHEVDCSQIAFGIESREEGRKVNLKWFPYNKGGEYRKWFGNIDAVVNWHRDGEELQNTLHPAGTRIWAHNFNLEYIFGEAVTWTDITSTGLAARYMPKGCIFDATGLSAFYKDDSSLFFGLAVANSIVAATAAPVLNPTLHFKAGDFKRLPLPASNLDRPIELAKGAILISKTDWDSFETSWDFARLGITNIAGPGLRISWEQHAEKLSAQRSALRDIEVENNRIFIAAYGLQDELNPEVPESQITLARADREKDMQRMMSYAIGCMMGRYSLDEPGLIYAHAGNLGFNATRYQTFPADADGIVPTTDEFWFEDDAANRVREFLLAVWGADTLNENMAWLAESLGAKANETPGETIRRYLSSSFFKDHLQTYKKRPIYWLFSSGKQKAFEALVYLHRYNEGTLARMRAEYVVPLTGKMAERIKLLEDDALRASTPAARKKIDKDIEKLKKKLDELRTYDEKLRHYADMRISLDLDDGVKANYGKFGDLLAEVKAVTGGAEE